MSPDQFYGRRTWRDGTGKGVALAAVSCRALHIDNYYGFASMRMFSKGVVNQRCLNPSPITDLLISQATMGLSVH